MTMAGIHGRGGGTSGGIRTGGRLWSEGKLGRSRGVREDDG